MSNDDLQLIKKRIYDEELIEKLLDELGCENVKYVGNRFEAGLPTSFGSTNRRTVQVYDSEHLASRVRSKGVRGDIYLLVGFILYDARDFEELQENLFQVKAWICNLFNWNEYLSRQDDFEEIVEKKDYLFYLRGIQKKRKKRKSFKKNLDKKNTILDKDKATNWYVKSPHKVFLDDGVDIETQKEFEVMFDMDSERVVFPIYNAEGELVSVKGRYVGKNQQTMEDVKYIYLYHFDKSIELYNLNKAYEYIKNLGEVIVFESEKSCMKAWQYGVKNTVAISGNEISPIQIYLLKSLEANIVFAFDNDIELEHIEKVASQIKTRKSFYIKDDIGLLGEKDSPVDGGKSVWEKIYSSCMKTITPKK